MRVLSQRLTCANSAHVVVGGTRGIGLALTAALLKRSTGRVFAASRRPDDSTGLAALMETYPLRLSAVRVDTTDSASVSSLAAQIGEQASDGVDLLLNVAGLLHDKEGGLMPERSLKAVDAEAMQRVLAVNAVGPVLVTQALQPHLRKGAVIGNVSARVGSISDNGLGGWWSYRMSKAALNMATRNTAIEGRRRKQIAVALHPGTTDTELSEPFQRNVKPEKLFSAEFTANALLDVLEKLEPEDSGGFFAYDGSAIEF